jgi:hypothetical protein
MAEKRRSLLPVVVVYAALGAAAVVAAVAPRIADNSTAENSAAENGAAAPTHRTALPAVAGDHSEDGDDRDGDDQAAARSLRGLWSRNADADGRDDAPVAFYYFHEGDIGLFRYGRIAYNTTNSYHWLVRGDDLELRWNKTGAVSRLHYRIDATGPRPVLIVDSDPKNPDAASSRYTFVPAPDAAARAPDLLDVDNGPVLSANHDTLDRIDNRLWIDLKKYAAGGIGFSLWQLRGQGIDGRGTGWHHVGDFDDWSTEQLTYRSTATSATTGTLEVLFSWRKERATTTWTLRRDGEARVVRLSSDPRDFGAVHDYVDAGPSFAGFGLGR